MDILILLFLILGVVAYLLLRRKPSGLQQISTRYLPETFIVLDLETTGLDAKRHEIIEIAAIHYKKGNEIQKTFQTLVKPQKKIPKKITEITGITQEMVEQEGRQLFEALRMFTQFIGTERLVTFNAEFDMAFLDAAWEKMGLSKPKNSVSCALKMAKRAWPGRKSYRLSELAADGKFAEGRAHRALEDARCALIVYVAAVGELKKIS